jgi:hypothetical protein
MYTTTMKCKKRGELLLLVEPHSSSTKGLEPYFTTTHPQNPRMVAFAAPLEARTPSPCFPSYFVWACIFTNKVSTTTTGTTKDTRGYRYLHFKREVSSLSFHSCSLISSPHSLCSLTSLLHYIRLAAGVSQ